MLVSDLGKRKKDYFGLTIYELASHPVTHATVCSGEEHQKWTGTFAIDRTEGSYRYGDEVQFVVWSTDPPKIKMERAPNDGYYRIEICIPKQEAVRLLETALTRIYNAEKVYEESLPVKNLTKLADVF